MSTGFAPIPLLKAAPEPDQIAERLGGGPWQGLELALAPGDVADDEALARAVEATRAGTDGRELVLTAEAPVAWPSGAFVRVDRLTDEARACIERSAEFARAIGSPVLTIHLYAPMAPDEFRDAPPLDEEAVERFLALLRRRLPRARRHAADRERPARPAHAHGRRLLLPGRRPLARPAPLARAHPRAPLHARHVARGALSLVRGRLSDPLRPRRRTRASSSSATSTSSGRPPRSPTSPTRSACSAKDCRSGPARSSSIP